MIYNIITIWEWRVMDVSSSETMNAMLHYIDEHLEENITTKGLAEIAGYSKFHFLRMFKAYTDATISEF